MKPPQQWNDPEYRELGPERVTIPGVDWICFSGSIFFRYLPVPESGKIAEWGRVLTKSKYFQV